MSERRSKSHLCAVELTQFSVAEEDAVHVLVHLFQPDLFVAEDFADKDSALMPANVPAVVHSPRLERFGYRKPLLCWAEAECWACRCFLASRWQEPHAGAHG